MTESSNVASRLAELERSVALLAARLDAIDERSAKPVVSAAAPLPPSTAAPTVPPEEIHLPSLERLQGVPALAGRTFVVMGGAFLVRSLAESGTLSAGLGVTLGVVYALVWLVLADRAAARGQSLGGTFHALASALVVYPLLVEAPTRLGLLAPWPAALLLAFASAAGLAVAWRRDFRTVAWIQQIAALATATLLLFRTRSPLPFGGVLLALAVASLILAYRRGWRGQRWLVAIGVDVVVLLIGALKLGGRETTAWLDLRSVLLLQIGLVTIYLGAFVLRLLVQSRDVTPFAIVQTAAALLIGFEGALLVGEPSTRTTLAIAALATGAVLHGLLARRSEQRFGHGLAVGYFSTVATFLAAEGVRVLLPSNVAASIWLAAAVTLGAVALGGDRPILQVHAALLALAGGLVSGLVAASAAALARSAAGPWPELGTAPLVVLALSSTTAALLYRRVPRGGAAKLAARAARAARIVALSVTLLGLGGLAVRLAGGALANAPGPLANAGILAALRSAVLAAAAIALTATAVALRRSELVRLAWCVLALGGIKLALEDLRVAGAAHLVFSLALYGAALIVVPALARRLRREATPAAAP
jgi:hypothetical protein